MSHACCGEVVGKAREAEPTTLGVADWLALMASPALAIMALISASPGESPTAMLCGDGQASPLGGMVAMYALMSAFHAAPWLRLVAARRG